MRIAPVGLWNCDRPDHLGHDVAVASIVTHRHPLAVDAAIAVATAVAHVVIESTIETTRLLQVVSEAVEERSPDFARHIQQLDAWLELAESTALEAIADLGPARGAHGFGIPAMAEPTVLAALYTFLRSPGDFMETIDCALHVGGDVDTVAAIAGAICGAHNGLDAIPRHLVTGVKGSEEILELGARLFARRYP